MINLERFRKRNISGSISVSIRKSDLSNDFVGVGKMRQYVGTRGGDVDMVNNKPAYMETRRPGVVLAPSNVRRLERPTKTPFSLACFRSIIRFSRTTLTKHFFSSLMLNYLYKLRDLTHYCLMIGAILPWAYETERCLEIKKKGMSLDGKYLLKLYYRRSRMHERRSHGSIKFWSLDISLVLAQTHSQSTFLLINTLSIAANTEKSCGQNRNRLELSNEKKIKETRDGKTVPEPELLRGSRLENMDFALPIVSLRCWQQVNGICITSRLFGASLNERNILDNGTMWARAQ